MFKGEGKFSIFIVATVILAMVASFSAVPKYPELPTHSWIYDRDEDYFPGAAKCTPSRLSKLPEQSAADEKYHCDIALEREKNQELIQSMRSADAAVASVEISFRQTILAIVGAAFGVLTLMAAAFAAWYARAGAIAARGTQNSYIEVERANPIIGLDNFRYDEANLAFDLVVTNVGGSACVVVLYSSAWIINRNDKPNIYTGHSKVIPISAGNTEKIGRVTVDYQSIRLKKYFDGRISFISSLIGEESKDFLFEVFDTRTVPHDQTHIDVLSRERMASKQQ